jgi:hypothetical protein
MEMLKDQQRNMLKKQLRLLYGLKASIFVKIFYLYLGLLGDSIQLRSNGAGRPIMTRTRVNKGCTISSGYDCKTLTWGRL